MAITKLLTSAQEMSRDRFKQEAALIVLDRMMEAVAGKIAVRFEGTDVHALSKSLSQFEECRGAVFGAVAEAIADAVTARMGPQLPDGDA